jgi:hypothetical protein
MAIIANTDSLSILSDVLGFLTNNSNGCPYSKTFPSSKTSILS